MNNQLFASVKEGKLNEVVSLLEGGANPNSSYYGLGALHAACCYGHFEIIKALLLFGANPNQRTDRTNKTPSDIALLFGESLAIQALQLFAIIGNEIALIERDEVGHVLKLFTSPQKELEEQFLDCYYNFIRLRKQELQEKLQLDADAKEFDVNNNGTIIFCA